MKNEIEYLEQRIKDVRGDSDCIDRKDSLEAYDVYSKMCYEVRLLESILKRILESEE